MTSDEQEALSFRYVAPRVFRLSSGNIALCPMIGREPPIIYTPEAFMNLLPIPSMQDLEDLSKREDAAMRARMQSLAPKPFKTQASLDDLA